MTTTLFRLGIKKFRIKMWRAGVLALAFALVAPGGGAEAAGVSLHDLTAGRFIERLASPDAAVRASAAENLGFLRAYQAAPALALLLRDESAECRRRAALSLAWCGGRAEVDALLAALDDSDWSVRQSAWVALTNLTGQEFPFEAQLEPQLRNRQAGVWRDWWSALSAAATPPCLVLDDLIPDEDLALGRPVSASTTYKGPPDILTDAAAKGFWQTKEVPFPQYCTVDLGVSRSVGAVAVTQYGRGYCMTDYAVEISDDGGEFREILRKKESTDPDLVIALPECTARFVRVVSHANEFARYPTTFYRISVFAKAPAQKADISPLPEFERRMRALGALGYGDSVERICAALGPYAGRRVSGEDEKLMVQVGIRALGRLAGPAARDLLITFLDNPYWARYAADALGDVGDTIAATALMRAYPDYASPAYGKPPAKLTGDDRPGFEAVDRMYEAPYAIALALSRFTFESAELRETLRALTPLLVMNMAGDFDGAMLYEEQAYHQVNRYLLTQAGVCDALCELALQLLRGAPEGGAQGADGLDPAARAALVEFHKKSPGGTAFAAGWLTALCRDRRFAPRLLELLEHENGWVVINAAKTLMFMHEKSAATRLFDLLKASKPEAEYGYNPDYLFKVGRHQGQDEYNAPAPCVREALTRALGALGGTEHLPLFIQLLNDDRNVLEVRYAALVALDSIGGADALVAVADAAAGHPFHSIRLKAREALWKRGMAWESVKVAEQVLPGQPLRQPQASDELPQAYVFIKGGNSMPNDFQIDIWRQAYSTTDSGPTYRPGDNLYRLDLQEGAAPKVTALTAFTGGYVADCEVCWDGAHVLFSRREAQDPWWHVWELELASGRMQQLTFGPYHDVQPNYLADGRIVFSSSRIGLRDEYHGYPATGLTVMERDGSGIRCIGFNLGRDNEPVVMEDGRILFSRLELFYSRLKTEITVQAVRPDGTMNVTLYGPERRDFWRKITAGSGERGWGEIPPRHRVLRLTQPQPLNRQQAIVATTGGATVIGPGRMNERVIPRWNNMAVTTPFPLDEQRVLCAATVRTLNRREVDLGLYIMELETGELQLLYNDPETADFEARPIRPRSRPRVLPDTVRHNDFTARLLCSSVKLTQEVSTRRRGKLVRIIEGQPVLSRHHTHTSSAGEAWKNHVGTHARVLGTVPLGADGSFYVEIPADRLVHCQVLDSDRRVVGNQLIWMYARPGAIHSCVGCHEMPDTAGVSVAAAVVPYSAGFPPIPCLPSDDAFSYRAKAWQKGTLLIETEERTRTVNAISFPGRF